jgi:hypothetical protein
VRRPILVLELLLWVAVLVSTPTQSLVALFGIAGAGIVLYKLVIGGPRRGGRPTLVDLAAHRERLRQRAILGGRRARPTPPTGGNAA